LGAALVIENPNKSAILYSFTVHYLFILLLGSRI
jgi:hypothetical protein